MRFIRLVSVLTVSLVMRRLGSHGAGTGAARTAQPLEGILTIAVGSGKCNPTALRADDEHS